MISRRLPSAAPYAIGLTNFSVVNILYRLERGTFFGGDSSAYLQIAEALRAAASLTAASKPLGYPMALALVDMLPGGAVANALALNAVLYLLTIYVVGRLGRRLGLSETGSRAVQCGFAAIPNPSLWANLVLAETLAMALFAAAALAYCGIEQQARSFRQALRPVVACGVLVAALGITRVEYLLLVPLITVMFGRHLVRKKRPLRDGVLVVSILWAVTFPLLLMPPSLSGWRVWSPLPAGYSGFATAWLARYDFEFTHYRVYRLAAMIHAAPTSPYISADTERARIHGLKYDYLGGSAIDDRVLDAAAADLQRVREAGRSRGWERLGASDAFRDQWRDDAGRMVYRIVRRFALYILAENSDWPRSQPAYWAYTIPLSPVSVFAYVFAVALIATGHPYRRADMWVLAAWMVFPAVVHAPFNFEQRYAHPSIPLLCVACGLGVQAAVRRLQRPQSGDNR